MSRHSSKDAVGSSEWESESRAKSKWRSSEYSLGQSAYLPQWACRHPSSDSWSSIIHIVSPAAYNFALLLTELNYS